MYPHPQKIRLICIDVEKNKQVLLQLLYTWKINLVNTCLRNVNLIWESVIRCGGSMTRNFNFNWHLMADKKKFEEGENEGKLLFIGLKGFVLVDPPL